MRRKFDNLDGWVRNFSTTQNLSGIQEIDEFLFFFNLKILSDDKKVNMGG